MKTLLFSSTSSLATVLLLSWFGNLALAEEPTFIKLQEMCRNANDSMQYGYCIGFVEAIALRIAHENKNCTFLQDFIDNTNANLAFPDLISDLNPKEYSNDAFGAVEKFFYNKGCS
jgi:hypothetical protein